MFKTFANVAIASALFVGVVIGINEIDFGIFKHFAPRIERVRRETYEQSRAFQEGTVRDLENLSLEYAAGNQAVKEAIRAVALHRLADLSSELLTPNLRSFKSELEIN
jgi:hypothetical protein